MSAIAVKVGNFADSTTGVLKGTSGFQKVVSAATDTLRILSYSRGAHQYPLLAAKLSNAASWIGALDLFENITYFWKREYESDSFPNVLANASFLGAGIGFSALWLEEVKLFNYSAIAQNIGQMPYLGGLSQFGLAPVLFGVCILGHSCMAVDAIQRLSEGGNAYRQGKTMLELASSVAAIAATIFAMSAVASPLTVPIVGLAYASISVIKMIYSSYFCKQIQGERL